MLYRKVKTFFFSEFIKSMNHQRKLLVCSIFLKRSTCRFNLFYLYCMRVCLLNSFYTVDQTKQAIDNLILFTGTF